MNNVYIEKIKLIKKNFNLDIKEFDIENFIISSININTELPYYIVKVLYSEKKINESDETKQLFSEYILEKNNGNILHYFCNNINKDNTENTKKEKCNSKDIFKFFYYEGNWVIIPEIKELEIYLKKTFNNINDIYEILNKNFYYTYFIENEKLIFISKGKMNSTEQIYGINEIFLKNDKYIFIRKMEKGIKKEKDDKICKYGLKCINPKCYYNHPKNYNINKSYREYIVEEKKKNSIFKSIVCKGDNSNSCTKHKYNKCIFLHEDDPIN
jgi:hypothetical protein